VLFRSNFSLSKFDDSELGADDPAVATSFHRSDCEGATFRRARLRKVDLSRAYLASAKFQDADLSMAVMEGAYVAGAAFERSNLTGVNAEEADLSGVDLRQAKSVDGLQLKGAKGLTDEMANWLNHNGAVDAAPRPGQQDESMEFLPYLEVSIFCPPSAHQAVMYLLHEQFRDFGQMGKYEEVKFTSALGDIGYFSTTSSIPRKGSAGSYSTDQQVLIRTWVPVHLRSQIGRLADAIRQIDFYEHPVVTSSAVPIWLAVPTW